MQAARIHPIVPLHCFNSFARGGRRRRFLDEATALKKNLNCSAPKFSGLKNQPGNPVVQNLAVANPKFNDKYLSRLHPFAGLRNLYLINIPITDEGLKDIGTLTSLQRLTLKGVKDHRCWYQGTRQGLDDLTMLELRMVPIGDAGLAHLHQLKHLTTLDLTETGVTDAGLKHLARCESLAALTLWSTRVTGAGVRRFEGCEEARRNQPLWFAGFR